MGAGNSFTNVQRWDQAGDIDEARYRREVARTVCQHPRRGRVSHAGDVGGDG